MKSSCRAGLHRELLNSTSSTFHPVKRISGLHLKPYLKLQKKDKPPEIRPDSPRSLPMSQPRVANEGNAAPSLFPNPSFRMPLGSLSPPPMCSQKDRRSPAEEERAAPTPTIHQGDDGEGPLDIWAVVKPGNTKEKVAFFAAQQCPDHRVSSMKNKSRWDIEGRATKRRKKSLDLRRAKVHPERAHEVSGGCPHAEPCSVDPCSVHHANEGGGSDASGFLGRPLSVVEMVAFLEQRASVLLAGCAKNCPGGASIVAKPSTQPKSSSHAPGPFAALEVQEAPPGKEAGGEGDGGGGGGGNNGEAQSEPVRVLEMVAKLESDCLRRQSERESGSLAWNSSFRRNVGRVLLAAGAAAEPEAGEASPGTLCPEECGQEGGNWGSKGNLAADPSIWRGPCPDLPSAALSGPQGRKGEPQLSRRDPDAPGRPCGAPTVSGSQPSAFPKAFQVQLPPLQSRNAAAECVLREPTTSLGQSSSPLMHGSVNISISVSRTEKGCQRRSPLLSSSFGEDGLPGRLFLLLSEIPRESQPGDQEASDHTYPPSNGGREASGTNGLPAAGRVSGPSLESPPALPGAVSPGLKRQRSHDFLETRFKIQQLLEPQQYLPFLPHHIIVKIFGFLPTRSLVALKCTCGYFKFIIEYYNVRPADSRWVRDPRYREDPCKQCKMTYTKGDVSLCRWHPKPYCQALPYGPGYWMCCHRSQKTVPGCKLGLHDNHWVPACHTFNRAIHKKPREPDEDC